MQQALRLVIAALLILATVPAMAQTTQTLYAQPTSPARDNYTGAVGCRFQVGSSNVVVSHLGYLDHNGDGGAGLAISHNVGIFNNNLASPTLIGQVTVPAGQTRRVWPRRFW